jgi:hypothetical protein
MQVLFHICRETIVIMRPEKIIIAGCWTSRFIGSKAERRAFRPHIRENLRSCRRHHRRCVRRPQRPTNEIPPP